MSLVAWWLCTPSSGKRGTSLRGGRMRWHAPSSVCWGLSHTRAFTGCRPASTGRGHGRSPMVSVAPDSRCTGRTRSGGGSAGRVAPKRGTWSDIQTGYRVFGRISCGSGVVRRSGARAGLSCGPGDPLADHGSRGEGHRVLRSCRDGTAARLDSLSRVHAPWIWDSRRPA